MTHNSTLVFNIILLKTQYVTERLLKCDCKIQDVFVQEVPPTEHNQKAMDILSLGISTLKVKTNEYSNS